MPKEQLKTLTEQMYYVLLALKRERCGVDITEYVLLRTDGRLRLGPGTLYSMLSKFEDEQLIEKDPGGRTAAMVSDYRKRNADGAAGDPAHAADDR